MYKERKQSRVARVRRLPGLTALFIGCCLTVLTGCNDNPAKEVTKQFLASNLKQPDFDIIDCSSVDSTTRVSSAAISDMRRATAGRWKGSVKYAAPTSMLRYINVSYVVDKDTLHQTFYLNDDMTNIVGVKDMLTTKVNQK